uniref:Leucine-rich repeat protein soc-2 homolog n=1 Tax=Heterorhabditis bacteriophora TaxID=37862 RepID=A0A1I7WPN6_HETBA
MPASSSTCGPILEDIPPLPVCLQQQQVLLSRSTEKMFEDAELSGVLSLAGRKLKEFPSNLFTKYDISDLVSADLSSNRLVDIPASICELQSLESLRVRGNTLRRIPSNIALLAALTFFDLSNNHLTQLPVALFDLPLEILLLTGNRLETIPREIRQLSSTLTELDISCNHLRSLPADIALLKMLRVLILRQNLLDQFPSVIIKIK